jgi:hypothetical protein
MMRDKQRVGLLLLLGALLLQSSHIAQAQTKKEWEARLLATHRFMQEQMWNASNGNFIRRTDQPVQGQRSDSWGITIVLDAYSYMVRSGNLKPDDLLRYYHSSTALYERTDDGHGARIIARQGAQIYVGGDDELQWIAALCNCFEATKDSLYLNDAKGAFNALVALGFWKAATDKAPAGWAWNSNDLRPMGVSTSYGALAAARLYQVTGDNVYRQWALVALTALTKPQISFIPRDKMIAAEAALILYGVSPDQKFLEYATTLANQAMQEIDLVMSGKHEGERNPTDVGDLAEGFMQVADKTGKKSFAGKASQLVNFFFIGRMEADIAANGFYSRYRADKKAMADLDGAYIGVPLSARFLPEVAEMLKLEAEMLLRAH